MKSLILILIYLAKEVFHRWKSRCSSPLARVLVVLFLTMAALIVLSNFLVSTKIIENEIEKNGGSVVLITETVSPKEMNVSSMFFKENSEYKSYLLNEYFLSAKIDNQSYRIVEYPISSISLFSKFITTDVPFLVLQKNPNDSKQLVEISIANYFVYGKSIPASESILLKSFYPYGAIFCPEGVFPVLKKNGYIKKEFVVANRLDAKLLERIETSAKNIIKLDERSAYVHSSKHFVNRLSRIKDDQNIWRIAISLGIAFIVGILLTSISSMEFRQNEFTYALMSSFGVRRSLLVFSFIAENIFLTFSAFFIAVFSFFKLLPIILFEVFKTRSVSLSFAELLPDLKLIALSLFICVLISTIPIIISIYRPIGRVLK